MPALRLPCVNLSSARWSFILYTAAQHRTIIRAHDRSRKIRCSSSINSASLKGDPLPPFWWSNWSLFGVLTHNGAPSPLYYEDLANMRGPPPRFPRTIWIFLSFFNITPSSSHVLSLIWQWGIARLDGRRSSNNPQLFTPLRLHFGSPTPKLVFKGKSLNIRLRL
jgi:hypothetical protein